ncbi:MAG TPA: hypothetical protein VMR81_00650 [Patescibacteria group bacterium]|nr:hypothetical protein [Patescibacteria group bacterium]
MDTPQLSRDEAIRRIEQLGGTYDPDSHLPLLDQLLICESIAESTPVDPIDIDGRTILSLKGTSERSASVNGSVNDIGKRQENAEETQKKKQAIAELTTYTYKTSPKKIASLLQVIFLSSVTKDSHWLWIAQHYTPKSINGVIHQMTKAHVEGWMTIKSPAAYFTDELKHHHNKRRKPKKKLVVAM